jgi:hypothetical protein
MVRTPRRPRNARRSRVLGTRLAELSLAAPLVIAARTTRMIAAGATPDAADRREMRRMGSEKVAAFSQGFVAMALRAQRMQFEWWLAALRPFFGAAWLFPWSTPRSPGPRATARSLARSLEAIAGAGLAPVHRTAVANARRLSRRKR